MRGFTDKALILMPEYDDVMSYNPGHIIKMRNALSNLLTYLDSVWIESHGIYTDELIHTIDWEHRMKLFNLFDAQDTYFIYNNIADMKGIATAETWKSKKPYKKSKEFTDDMARFDEISKNEKKLAQQFIQDYKVVFNFMFKGKKHYKVASNPNDGNMRVYVDASTLIPEVYLSGEKVDACEMFQIDYGNLPLTDWKG